MGNALQTLSLHLLRILYVETSFVHNKKRTLIEMILVLLLVLCSSDFENGWNCTGGQVR